jgi:hypothetical protein
VFRVVLAVGTVLIIVLVTTLVFDFVAHPRDLWVAGFFTLGSLCGAAWERDWKRRRG